MNQSEIASVTHLICLEFVLNNAQHISKSTLKVFDLSVCHFCAKLKEKWERISRPGEVVLGIVKKYIIQTLFLNLL